MIQDKADRLYAYIARLTRLNDKLNCFAMVGGAPFFQMAVNFACMDNGVLPLAAYSERVSVESVQADGALQNIFKHKGFIPCNVVSRN